MKSRNHAHDENPFQEGTDNVGDGKFDFLFSFAVFVQLQQLEGEIALAADLEKIIFDAFLIGLINMQTFGADFLLLCVDAPMELTHLYFDVVVYEIGLPALSRVHVHIDVTRDVHDDEADADE